jgi:hypothetical protein
MLRQDALGVSVTDHGAHAFFDPNLLCRALLGRVARGTGVLSLHLDTEWRDERQRERVRVYVKHHAAQLGKANRQLADDLAHAVAFVDGLTHRAYDEQYAGIAAFFCRELDLDFVVHLHRSLAPRFHLGARPLVGPILRLLSDSPAMIVAVTSRVDTRLWEFRATRLRERETIAREVPARTARGGWSQLRFQHHVDWHAAEQLRVAAAAITKRFDELGELPWVLVGGPLRVADELGELLPARVQEKLIPMSGVSRYDGESAVFERAEDALKQGLARERARLLDAVLAIHSDGRSAAGPLEVAEAADRARLGRLLIHEELHRFGARCLACDLLYDRALAKCEACGGQIEQVALEDALPEAAVGQAAPIELIHGDSPLEQMGYVAAMLRW